MKKLNTLDWVAIILLVVGGLNWGLIGIFGFDLVKAVFGDMSVLSRIIYSIVGISSFYVLGLSFQLSKAKEETVGQHTQHTQHA